MWRDKRNSGTYWLGILWLLPLSALPTPAYPAMSHSASSSSLQAPVAQEYFNSGAEVHKIKQKIINNKYKIGKREILAGG